jgi:toxin ParE1/3/4
VRSLRLAPRAQRDLADLFSTSEEQFGDVVADRYRRLVAAALRDLRADPERAGVRPLQAGSGDIRLYHLRHSRAGLPAGRTIARPRHFLAFREVDGQVIVIRVLHDAMDLHSRLSEA